MTIRFRITVRNDDIELRGYIDVASVENLNGFANSMKDIGIVVASPAADDYNPFHESRVSSLEAEVLALRETLDQTNRDYQRDMREAGRDLAEVARDLDHANRRLEDIGPTW